MDYGHDVSYCLRILEEPFRLHPTYNEEDELQNVEVVRDREDIKISLVLRRFVARILGPLDRPDADPPGTYVNFLLYGGPALEVFEGYLLDDKSRGQTLPMGGRSQLVVPFDRDDRFDKNMRERVYINGGLFLPRADFELRIRNLKDKPTRHRSRSNIRRGRRIKGRFSRRK